jgi:hypothetical protein
VNAQPPQLTTPLRESSSKNAGSLVSLVQNTANGWYCETRLSASLRKQESTGGAMSHVPWVQMNLILRL